MGTASERLREVADRLEAKRDEAKGRSAEALGRVVLKLEDIAAKIEAGLEVDEEPEPAEPTGEEPHVEHREGEPEA
jgi:hypothetical protein